MKLIEFVMDYRTDCNLPKAPAIGIDKEYHVGDIRYKKGTRLVLPDDKAKHFCKRGIDWNYHEKTGKYKMISFPAKVVKDLGRHIGRSRHIYLRNGKSRVFGCAF